MSKTILFLMSSIWVLGVVYSMYIGVMCYWLASTLIVFHNGLVIYAAGRSDGTRPINVYNNGDDKGHLGD